MSHTSTSRLASLTLLASMASLSAVAQNTPPAAATASTAEPAVTLPTVVVEAESESDQAIQGPFLPDIQGTKINSGKKTSAVDFDALPDIAAGNYRQALALTPGLYLSEESTPLLSIGYRGLRPDRVQFTQVLADGVPIHADQFGYPEAYYTPPFDSVDRIEFVRGGAALMYGPQPGGALNYVTHRPRTDRQLAVSTENTFGEDSTWNSYTSIDGTTGRVGYYGYFNHRETEGFRASNSDVELDAGSVKLALDATGPNRVFVEFQAYSHENGEPGGLSSAAFAAGSNQTTRPFDRFKLERNAVTATWERDLDNGQFAARFWAVDYTRSSTRQNSGGFGTTPPPGSTFGNNVQEFLTLGADARVLQKWGSENQHALTLGAQAYHTDSDLTNRTSAAPGFTAGTTSLDVDRSVTYMPVFAENLFRFGKLSVTPGLRVENIRQEIEENVNTAAPVESDRMNETVPLLGLGVAYDVADKTQLYANFSESYRPVIFTQTVASGFGVTVADDLQESKALQYEVGVRSQAVRGLTLDASYFLLDFDNQINQTGTVPTAVIRNTGRAIHHGLEASALYDLLSLAAAGGHKLEVYANAMFLDAEVVSGVGDGTIPPYAPDYLIRSGVIYSAPNGAAKIALLGTFVDDANTGNTTVPVAPAHMVWDLTAEAKIPNTPLTALAGVNNLLDESYFSRVTNTGIDPAAGRTYYLGFRAEF